MKNGRRLWDFHTRVFATSDNYVPLLFFKRPLLLLPSSSLFTIFLACPFLKLICSVQVRLTVLPSVNGTNTTTSHGGLLEVEKTFKTVDQSQKEYEANKEKLTRPTFVNKRPIRNTFMRRPSNSALLAAVGAGMLPATMAMMIPMMLGRKKRSAPQPPKSVFEKIYENSERRYKLSRL